MLNDLFSKLIYGGDKSFRSYEKLILDKTAASFTERSRHCLAAQLLSVSLIQRWNNDRMVRIFLKDDLRAEDLFANTDSEVYCARVVYKEASAGSFRCDIVSSRGKLNTLEFNKPPKQWDPALLANALVTVDEDLLWRRTRGTSTGVLGGPVLNSIKEFLLIDSVEPAADQEDVSSFIERVTTTLPNDFVVLLAECNHFVSGQWTYAGTHSRRIPFPDGELLLLYENDPLSLCVKVDAQHQEIFFYNQLDQYLESVGETFVEALKIISINQPSP